MNHAHPVKLILRKPKSNQFPLNAQIETSEKINWVGFFMCILVLGLHGLRHLIRVKLLREQSQGGWLAKEKHLGN